MPPTIATGINRPDKRGSTKEQTGFAKPRTLPAHNSINAAASNMATHSIAAITDSTQTTWITTIFAHPRGLSTDQRPRDVASKGICEPISALHRFASRRVDYPTFEVNTPLLHCMIIRIAHRASKIMTLRCQEYTSRCSSFVNLPALHGGLLQIEPVFPVGPSRRLAPGRTDGGPWEPPAWTVWPPGPTPKQD